MDDIVLDTSVLVDFLPQYFLSVHSNNNVFKVENKLNKDIVHKINRILASFRNYNTLENGLVVASSFAFVEVARKFDQLASPFYSIEQFKAFVEYPPEWFHISPLNKELFVYFKELPSAVYMDDGSLKPIEWADAIHAATALSRDRSLLATSDTRLWKIPILEGRLI